MNPTYSATSDPWSVEKVLTTVSPRPVTNPPPTSPIAFFHLLERLKTTKREGWRRFAIYNGESISDHMYRMSIITMMAPTSLSSRLNIPHCTKMALIHDMAESLVGDITPVDGVEKGEKSRRESETMVFLTKTLLGNVKNGGQEAAASLLEIWQEYETNETLEAKFTHDVDKLELILQMVEYEKRHNGQLDLGEFVWVATLIKLEEVKQWAAEVLVEREIYWKGRGDKAKGADVEGLDIGREVISQSAGIGNGA